MNRIFEATKKDGTRQLVSPSVIRGYVDEARMVACGSMKKAMRVFGRMLANLMFVRGYVSIVEIAYDCNSQKRTVLMIGGAA